MDKFGGNARRPGDPRPVYACGFGGCAQSASGLQTTVDIVLAHPSLPGDAPEPGQKTWSQGLGYVLTSGITAAGVWDAHLMRRALVNDLHGVFEMGQVIHCGLWKDWCRSDCPIQSL